MALRYELIGDVDNNGKITSFDAMLILNHVAGLIQFNDDEIAKADVDGNLQVRATDAIRILYHLSGDNIIDEVRVVSE